MKTLTKTNNCDQKTRWSIKAKIRPTLRMINLRSQTRPKKTEEIKTKPIMNNTKDKIVALV